ncbi:MAG TPA: chromosome partitioning protein ParA, partial [Bacteroidota bacterium]|nr:chromosome partitioning protein ParA [Bacteroidota bacterium]
AMQGMMQAGGQGMGMAGFMQRLQQLTGQQQGINQGTQNLQGMSQQQLAELGRLAAEQGMVRKSLEQLAKEAAQSGELSKMLGDLNRIAQDMREVQTDLAQGNVNPETLKKQERILSRLLDSQRSARERDFERRRRAQTGANVTRKSPADIDLNAQEGRSRLQQDLQKALEEGYARDYQELIRRYYEALEKLEREK